jgi:hypothetical protein
MISEIEDMLRTAGFEQISVVPVGESKSFMRDWFPGMDITDYALSASIKAVKPYRFDKTKGETQDESNKYGKAADKNVAHRNRRRSSPAG